MKSKKKQNLIARGGIGKPLWLDGYNGGTDWEWTENKMRAWHMAEDEAQRRLALVQKTFPSAKIEIV